MSIERTFKRTCLLILRRLLPSPSHSISAPPAVGNILVVRQHNQLGDMLCAVPLLRSLRSRFPGARITLVASPVNVEVMQHSVYLDEIILFDKREYLTRVTIRLLRLFSFFRELRRKGFDLAVVPSTVSTSATSDLLAYCSGASTRVGAASIDATENLSSLFFTLPVPLDWRSDPHRHQTLRNLDIALPLGVHPENLGTEINLTLEERQKGREFLGLHTGPGSVGIAFHPGAGKVPNRWPAARFAAAANILAREFGARIFITSGPMDDEPVQEMVSHLSTPYALIRGKPIRVVASMLSHLRLVVTNDTGIMHVAAGVNAPVLSLFGPTDYRQWAPIGPDHRCIDAWDGRMESITVDRVVETAREMLRKQRD